MSQPVKTTSSSLARGTKSLISGDLLSVRLPRRGTPIWVGDPIGLASPRRMASTPAIIVVATAPRPTTITPSLPVAGAIGDAFWPPCSSIPLFSPNHFFDCSGNPGRSNFLQATETVYALRVALVLSPSHLLRLLRLPAASQMRPHKPDDSCQQRNLDHRMKSVKGLVEARVRVPRLAQLHADVRQEEAPQPGTQRNIKVKAQTRHSGNSCREGDKRLHNRHTPRHQHGDRAVLFKEPGHVVQIVAAHQHPLAVALHQRPSALGANPIRHRRAKIAAHHPRCRYKIEIEAPQIH